MIAAAEVGADLLETTSASTVGSGTCSRVAGPGLPGSARLRGEFLRQHRSWTATWPVIRFDAWPIRVEVLCAPRCSRIASTPGNFALRAEQAIWPTALSRARRPRACRASQSTISGATSRRWSASQRSSTSRRLSGPGGAIDTTSPAASRDVNRAGIRLPRCRSGPGPALPVTSEIARPWRFVRGRRANRFVGRVSKKQARLHVFDHENVRVRAGRSAVRRVLSGATTRRTSTDRAATRSTVERDGSCRNRRDRGDGPDRHRRRPPAARRRGGHSGSPEAAETGPSNRRIS